MKLTSSTRIAIGIAGAVIAISAFAAQSCVIDGSPMMWTGETKTGGGKLLYVLKCLHGHKALSDSPN